MSSSPWSQGDIHGSFERAVVDEAIVDLRSFTTTVIWSLVQALSTLGRGAATATVTACSDCTSNMHGFGGRFRRAGCHFDPFREWTSLTFPCIPPQLSDPLPVSADPSLDAWLIPNFGSQFVTTRGRRGGL